MPTPLLSDAEAAAERRRKNRRALHQRKMALKPEFERLGLSFDSHRSLAALAAQIRDKVSPG